MQIVRHAASTATENCPPADGWRCRGLRILQWVSDRMRYVPDPLDVEALGTPSYHLAAIYRHGRSWGDCDDATALIGAMARAVGMRVRLAVASFSPRRELTHIWAEAAGPDGAVWFVLDPFRGERFGGQPTRLIYREV